MGQQLRGARTLVTGASSGIGRELARQLAAAGARLLLTARREERLDALQAELKAAGAECHVLAGDIVSDEHRRRLVARWPPSGWGGLDLLIHNAGIGAIDPFDQSTSERLREVMEVNFFAPVELTRLALPLLGRGAAVVLVGSVLALAPVPLKSEYCASKAALAAWKSLQLELRGRGVAVLQAHPSTTRSEFFEQVRGDASAQRSLGAMTPQFAASRILRSIAARRPATIFPLAGRALVALRRWLPWAYRRLLASK